MRRLYTTFAIAAMLFANTAFSAEWGEGYDPVEPPASTNDAGKVEIVEFFWYGCPHCYTLDPHVEKWLETKPKNVTFQHIPAPLNPRWATHSRFFYAAEVMGVIDKLHKPLFEALHKAKKRINDKEALIDFAGDHGVDKDEFRKAWDSFAVAVKVQRAKKLAQQYQIDSVPVIGINGKYKTSAGLAGSNAGMFDIINGLIEQESAPAATAKK